MAATAFVGVTAFVLAYDGSAGAATDAGIAAARWYPFCIEGVIVAASVGTLALAGRVYPWVILAGFTVVSTAANVLHAWQHPGSAWWSLAFAAVPPLALPICLHLMLMVVQPARPEFGRSLDVPSPTLAASDPPVQPASNGRPAADPPSNGSAKTAAGRAHAAALTLREPDGQWPTVEALAAAASVSRGTAGTALKGLKEGARA